LPSATTSHTRDLVSGAVKPEGIGLTTLKLPLETIAYRFLGGFEWEVSEFSLATYCTFVSDGNSPMVGIPVFPSRVFGHGSILLREGSPVRMAAELMGKRIGIPQWTQTAVPYVRSWLQHDAGVALTSVDWVQAGVNDPGRKEMVAFELPRGIKLTAVPKEVSTELKV
jgi:4,5-dihydroxyphthalate decarboxylase